MISVYDIVMAPIERAFLHSFRSELISQAKDNVLEVGVGTGINLKYYDYSKVTALTCLDIEHSADIMFEHPNVHFMKGNIEEMPFDAQSFDCVVESLVLCSVDTAKSVQEMQRVLKHGGRFIFIEHVKPLGQIAAKIADIVNPAWSKIANGCNLNRQTDQLLENSGFSKITINQRGVFRYGIAEKA